MSGNQTRIAELASIISVSTAEIDNYLQTNKLPTPSFQVDAYPDLQLPPNLQKSRDDILIATTELRELVSGPLMHLTRLTSPTVNVLVSLQAIHRYKIASSFALDEEVSFAVVAERCNINEEDARQLIRVAVANHIFHEPRKGIVTHSAISKLIAQNPLLNQWIGLSCEDMMPVSFRTLDAMTRWPGSQEPHETAFSIHNEGRTHWEVLQNDPIRAKRFSDGMTFMQSAPVLAVTHLFNDLRWNNENCPSLLVDLGGSHGSICIELLRKFPKLKCVVEDLPEIIYTANVPDDLNGRLEFKSHDFFTEQPVKYANVYYIRWVLHDWSDKYARKILQNLVPALKNGAKVILNEVCLPEPNVLPYYHAQLISGFNLSMRQSFNSKKRDAEEWVELLRSVDKRFKLDRIVCSPGSMLAVIKVVWTEAA
ncbi:O-methyltransferase gsfB [Lachnellula suecica]|uniref:O-methyltransferase gsfB n=1 Tax=Lachnellula suecica TaxID=602035 RepID=A0A8T9CAJ5_9HELO|nr:O-methyltransferase gsfB [Lachnellula suecica]